MSETLVTITPANTITVGLMAMVFFIVITVVFRAVTVANGRR